MHTTNADSFRIILNTYYVRYRRNKNDHIIIRKKEKKSLEPSTTTGACILARGAWMLTEACHQRQEHAVPDTYRRKKIATPASVCHLHEHARPATSPCRPATTPCSSAYREYLSGNKYQS
jgi:hypothetical protein